MASRTIARTGLSLVLAVTGALALGAPALADNDVGCGVGTRIWEGQKGLFPKIMASMTNGWTFQSVSITFGVMGCNGRDTVTADAELRKFAAANMDRLARDVARGEGETLEAFAHLLRVDEASQEAFFAFTQAHFADLFPHERTGSGEMIDALYGLLAEPPTQG